MYPMLRAVYHMSRDEFLDATFAELHLLSENIPYVVGPGMNEQFGKRPRKRAARAELSDAARRAGMTVPKDRPDA